MKLMLHVLRIKTDYKTLTCNCSENNFVNSEFVVNGIKTMLLLVYVP